MPRHLILFPTDLERRLAAPVLAAGETAADRPAGEPPAEHHGARITVHLCGFGLAAAAARTAQLVAQLAPEHVILAGIAGRFTAADNARDVAPPLGAAACFSAVACHGIGVGSGEQFASAAALGWPQWPGDPPDPAAAIGDEIDCAISGRDLPADLPHAGLLLTVAAASADAAEARLRHRLHPAAVAEDMEGYAVALACRLAGVPCTIVRGFSNTVGDRDKSRWHTAAAVAAAAAIVRRLVAPH